MNEVKLSFAIETNVQDKDILQKVYTTKEFEQQRFLISEKLYKTSEEEFKKALIGLGWTPPKESK